MSAQHTPVHTSSPNRAWWKEAVVYQIYPRSFMDSNGDGIGDLKGITSKLDYLNDLGVNVLWLCPIFPSPNDDNGYDISDYQGIMAEFGTMADFDELLAQAHARGIKVLLDLVINHSSDEHAWFQESRSSKDNPKRDWYIWRPGKNDGPPNNWESIFTEPAWEYDPQTDEYFLHVFSRKQPDLNWDNLDMRAAVYDMIRWWLDKGVDGFRIDAITHIKKTPGLPDLPNPEGLIAVPSHDHHRNIEGIQEYITDLCDNTFAHYDIMTVGEANGVTVDEAPLWVGQDQKKFNMLFQFEQLKLWGSDIDAGLNLPELKRTLTRWQKGLEGKGWNALFVENHDIARIVSTWGDDQNYRYESSTALATMYFLMQGTPFIYQGQELGMTNFPFEHLHQFDDVAVRNLTTKQRAHGWTDHDILHSIKDSARDNSRTPMQWDDSPNAGFTTGTPWLAVNPNHTTINAAQQQNDPNSVLSYFKQMIRLRKEHEILVYGTYDLVLGEHEQVYAYTRTLNGNTLWVVCNLSGEAAHLGTVEGNDWEDRSPLLGNYTTQGQAAVLRPWEARVLV